nr:MAG TPA: biofilm formation stimulator [Caudoviricetes sp.]
MIWIKRVFLIDIFQSFATKKFWYSDILTGN